MNLSALLRLRMESGRPVRVALIGAGKFGSMFLAQVPTIPGLEVAVIGSRPGPRQGGLPHGRLGHGEDRRHAIFRRRR